MATALTTAPETKADPAATTTDPKGAATAPATTQDPKAAASQSWRDSLPDDLKSDPSIQHISDVANLTKSYIHAQKAIGSDKIALPNKHTTEAEKREIWHKLGLPREAKEYAVKAPVEGHFEDEFFNNYKTKAHELGLMPEQAEKLVSWFYDQSKNFNDAGAKAREAAYANGIDAIKKERGPSFNADVELAQRAIDELAGDKADEVKDWLDKTGVGNDPMMVRLMIAAGQLFKEDNIQGKTGAQFGKSADQLIKEMADINSNMKHPYWVKGHPAHDVEVKEMVKRREQLNRLTQH